MHMDRRIALLMTVLVLAVSFAFLDARQSVAPGTVAIDPDDIGGVVTGPDGPEAGVWVVAETRDLPTTFVRIVVTGDDGRYVLPDLPMASYQIFVRGYGLVDSPRVAAKPGQLLNLRAVAAADGRVAAQLYPPASWMSLMRVTEGQIPEQDLVSTVKQCLQCHALGNEGTRTMPVSGGAEASLAAWDARVKKGASGAGMSANFQRMGSQRTMFADWSERIAAGAFPPAPPRPSGLGRNVVISVWDWAWPLAGRSDAQGTSEQDPTVNADGLVYGAHANGNVLVWLNPKNHVVGEVPTGVEGLRSIALDRQGRVWLTGRLPAGAPRPAFCESGSTNRFTGYFPVPGRGKQVVMYDPKTEEVVRIPTCMAVDHSSFGTESDAPLYFGGSNLVGWVSTETYDETHELEASQGWCPAVLDTNGDGRITEWTEPQEAIDPVKDHRIEFGCYSISVSPLDGSLWCSGVGPGDTKLVRIDRGTNPPQSCSAEVYVAPDVDASNIPFFKSGGVAVDRDGVAWLNWRGSDQVTSFDRRKCEVTSGPTATGLHCEEGWTSYQMDRPTFAGTTVSRHAEMMYLTQLDRHDVLGLGRDSVVSGPVNSDSLQVLVPSTGQFLDLVVPYPMGFFSRSAQGRIDNPDTGWKGRGLWSNYSTYTPHFIEGGTGPKVVKFQMRPGPLEK
jgi:hypothetical protein